MAAGSSSSINLMMELKFGVDQIVGAAAVDLTGVYRNLTGETGDPFPHFKECSRAAIPARARSPMGTLTTHGRSGTSRRTSSTRTRCR